MTSRIDALFIFNFNVTDDGADACEQEPPEDTGTSSAELAEIVRRFINMVERRDEKIAQLEAEIERLKAQLSAISSN